MGLLERFDIQEWIAVSPEILGEDLLIIAKEYRLLSGIRMDLLAVDRNASLVIVELKRDDSGNAVEWQAIKYASYCSNFTSEQIFSFYTNYFGEDVETAQEKIEEFVHEDLSHLNQNQRIILVAREFHSDVASAVLWLRDYGLDIVCIRLRPYVDSDNSLFITPAVIIPLPEARDYIERRENKRRDEKQVSDFGKFYATDKGDYDPATLEAKLRESLGCSSSRATMFGYVLAILLRESRTLTRDEIKNRLHEQNLAESFGKAGNHMSSVSKYVSYKDNAHIRQMIEYTSEDWPGAPKEAYRIVPQYEDLVRRVLDNKSEQERGPES
ncbi:endonuclease NucS domain-containing protein [Rubrobacter indicoceani]|uniref:endonuclease NucS domain-containing protein n=1 Tax=Rubrobacter indicoceani TaxID=2051957 RepID=UPI0019698333|nr:endonuclease NucS domain-containing protein [Rubrobacter indicoceani]